MTQTREVWQPTNWASVDAILDFEVVWLVGAGRLILMPDPCDPGNMAWSYAESDGFPEDRQPGDPVESAGPFNDEVYRAYHNGWITWVGDGDTPVITDAGKLFLAGHMLNPPQYQPAGRQ